MSPAKKKGLKTFGGVMRKIATGDGRKKPPQGCELLRDLFGGPDKG